jgi:hypothetical protein
MRGHRRPLPQDGRTSKLMTFGEAKLGNHVLFENAKDRGTATASSTRWIPK